MPSETVDAIPTHRLLLGMASTFLNANDLNRKGYLGASQCLRSHFMIGKSHYQIKQKLFTKEQIKPIVSTINLTQSQ
jgi:hypothetical protein